MYLALVIWGAWYAYYAERSTRRNFLKICRVLEEEDKVGAGPRWRHDRLHGAEH